MHESKDLFYNELPRYTIYVYETYVCVYGWITVDELKYIIDMFSVRGYCYVEEHDGECLIRLSKKSPEIDDFH